MNPETRLILETFIAGLVASIACGLGALPLLIPGLEIKRRMGYGYAFAGGLMMSASVYNLLLPGLNVGAEEAFRLRPVLEILLGMLGGATMLWLTEKYLTPERLESRWLKPLGGRVEALIFLAMAFHSIPEGVAVGVGYGAEEHHASLAGFGFYIAVAIAIHNIPEGLAVALPMRAAGASIGKCFFFAFLTSLPQPLAAVPASLLVWFFEPLMLPLLGFAAGAMMFLVIVELIPDALETRTHAQTAWAFMAGFGLMLLVQAAL